MRRWVRRILIALGVVTALALALAGLVTWRLRASLPALDGEIAVAGLASPVTVERDDLGVPTLRGTTRLDLARATGFVHAQDRFFQMDLLRRAAAGEVAALLGRAALEVDRRNRLHRFRARAERSLRQARPADRAAIDCYTQGVNAGLAGLGAPPPEYLLLRTRPAPWKPEDVILASLGMFLVLQGERWNRDSALGLMHEILPPEVVAFLVPRGTEWDAPLVGAPDDAPPIPDPGVYDLRRLPPGEAGTGTVVTAPATPGSNSWAVAGRLTEHGGAILANDMHLGLALPNIWYRVSLDLRPVDADEGAARRVTGVTLPGTPVVVAGSNGSVAWGFTNAYGDSSDLVVLELDAEDPEAYLTPAGPRRFVHEQERIRVRGEGEVALDVMETIWGPVIDRDRRGRPRALRWVAYDEAARSLELMDLEAVRTVEEASLAAAECSIPLQNFVAADRHGSIGWTVMGRLAGRGGTSSAVPVPWRDAGGPTAWLAPADYPRIVNPASGRIWTANNRVADGPLQEPIGDGGFDLGARAGQIRDALLRLERATEQDMLAIQLDDGARFLERWRELLLGLLTPEATAGGARRAELRDLLERGWTGRASVDSSAYRFVRAFRSVVADRVFRAVTAPVVSVDPDFRLFEATSQWEGPLWRLVTARPAHLLDPTQESWESLLLAAADAAVAEVASSTEAPLAARVWGERNTVRLRHPLSAAVPALGRWLDLEPVALPGDAFMPRVQSPRFGASERMVVAPGFEERGIFHMPGGQSGHPLSPYYRRGHEAWVRGAATPFLPGPPRHALTLVPAPPAGV